MRRYFTNFRQYMWIIPACMVLTAIIGFALAKQLPPVYQVSSTVFVNGQSNPGNPFSQSLAASDAIGVASNDASEITSRAVMDYVVNTFDSNGVLKKLGYSSDDLLADVTSLASATAPTISITASASNLNDPVVLANMVANGYIAYSQQKIQVQVNQLRSVLQTQLNGYAKDKLSWEQLLVKINNPSDPNITIYQNNIQDDIHNISLIEQQLLQLPTTVTPNVEVIQHAKSTDVALSSQTSLIIAAGGLVGLLVGLVVVMALVFLDNRLRSEEEVGEKLGLAYIGGVSKDHQLKDSALQLKGAIREEFADISANLSLTGILPDEWKAPNGAVLLVTSAQTAEGKTSIAVALAASVARGGSAVVVVDGNLRHPATHLTFGLGNNSIGLSGLLRSSGNVDDVVQRSSVPNVWLLAAGPATEESALLIEQKLPEVLTALRRKADLIIIDASSLLGGADASVMARMADGILLVVDVNRAKMPLLLRSRDILVSLAHKPAGVIMNRFAHHQPNRYYATSYETRLVAAKELPAHSSVGSNGNGHDSNEQKLEPAGAGRIPSEQMVPLVTQSLGPDMPIVPPTVSYRYTSPPPSRYGSSDTGSPDMMRKSPLPPPLSDSSENGGSAKSGRVPPSPPRPPRQ